MTPAALKGPTWKRPVDVSNGPFAAEATKPQGVVRVCRRLGARGAPAPVGALAAPAARGAGAARAGAARAGQAEQMHISRASPAARPTNGGVTP